MIVDKKTAKSCLDEWRELFMKNQKVYMPKDTEMFINDASVGEGVLKVHFKLPESVESVERIYKIDKNGKLRNTYLESKEIECPLVVDGNVTPLTKERKIAPPLTTEENVEPLRVNEFSGCDVSDYYSKVNSTNFDFERNYDFKPGNYTDILEFINKPDYVSDESEVKLSETDEAYSDKMNQCRDIFCEKLKEHGPTWRVMRTGSVIDQLYVRYSRIYNLNNDGEDVAVDIFRHELCAIVNYAIIGLMQIMMGPVQNVRCYADHTNDELIELFDNFAQRAYEMMKQKNAEYSDAWKMMRLCSYVDFIGMKTLKLIDYETELNKKAEREENYYDIINYAIFALIRLS